MASPSFGSESAMDSTANPTFRSPLAFSSTYNLSDVDDVGDVAPSTGGSLDVQEAHMSVTHNNQFYSGQYDGQYGGQYGTTNADPSFMQSLFKLEDANVAGYIQQLHSTHRRFRDIILDLTTFFYSREATSDNLIARILFSAWIQKHEALLRSPCFQEDSPDDLTRELFRRLGITVPPRVQCRRTMPPERDDGKLDMEVIRQLFEEAEDARAKFCEAFGALGSIARSVFPSVMTADAGLHSSPDVNLFLQWYMGSWCTGIEQAGVSLPAQCPLDRVELQQVKELICRACEHLDRSSGDSGAEMEWLADFQDGLQRYQDRVKRLQFYETVLTPKYRPKTVLTQRMRRDILKTTYKVVDCQLNMVEKIYGASPEFGDAIDLDCSYFEALFGRDIIGAGAPPA